MDKIGPVSYFEGSTTGRVIELATNHSGWGFSFAWTFKQTRFQGLSPRQPGNISASKNIEMHKNRWFFCSTGNESCINSIFVDPIAWARCVVDPKCMYPFCSLYYNLHFCQKQFTVNPPVAKVIFQTKTVQMRIKCFFWDVLIYVTLARLNFLYRVYIYIYIYVYIYIYIYKYI